MMSADQLERYRRMTPGERLALALELTAGDWRFLESLPPEDARRRWEFIRRRHQEGNRRLLEAFARER